MKSIFQNLYSFLFDILVRWNDAMVKLKCHQYLRWHWLTLHCLVLEIAIWGWLGLNLSVMGEYGVSNVRTYLNWLWASRMLIYWSLLDDSFFSVKRIFFLCCLKRDVHTVSLAANSADLDFPVKEVQMWSISASRVWSHHPGVSWCVDIFPFTQCLKRH